MGFNNNALQQLSKSEILALSEFIVKENFKHHAAGNLPENFRSDVEEIYNEELQFFDASQTFVAKSAQGEIEGSIRVLRWNYQSVLPIQKIFGINPIEIAGMSPMKHIYHIGRFAIKKEASDVQLFKKLMVCAIAPICARENAVAFAEIDSKLLRVLRALGIKATVVGESVDYLGSETIPVCMSHEGLISFYERNKHLVATATSTNQNEACTLPQSVVSTPQNANYTLV